MLLCLYTLRHLGGGRGLARHQGSSDLNLIYRNLLHPPVQTLYYFQAVLDVLVRRLGKQRLLDLLRLRLRSQNLLQILLIEKLAERQGNLLKVLQPQVNSLVDTPNHFVLNIKSERLLAVSSLLNLYLLLLNYFPQVIIALFSRFFTLVHLFYLLLQLVQGVLVDLVSDHLVEPPNHLFALLLLIREQTEDLLVLLQLPINVVLIFNDLICCC